MSNRIKIQPLTSKEFAPFGDVLEAVGAADKIINQGRCGRYHDLAKLDFVDAQAGISLFQSKTCTFPYELNLVERHPLGSQAFIPMSHHPFLIVVASDENGTPVNPQAFISTAGQAINIHRNIWHGVLTPLHEPRLFAVVDYVGDSLNLEEHHFEAPYLIE